MDQLHALIETLARGLEYVGVAVILAGVLLASLVFLSAGGRIGWRAAYEQYRANLGRGILLGLELLVGADIIGTITAPLTFESLGLLAIVVLVRTFLSFSLETEIEGCWPWQRSARRAGGDVAPAPR